MEYMLNNQELLTYLNESEKLEKLENENIKKIIVNAGSRLKKWIRLRQTGEETTIAIKKIFNDSAEYNLDDVKEVELKIPNIEVGKELLENLGYCPTNHQRKMRIAYDYKNTEIVIDKWPKIPPYIEVEGKNSEQIYQVVKELGFKKEDIKVMNTETVYALNGINLYDFEDLNFSKEEELLVENLLSKSKDKIKHSIIAISGMPAAGKTTLSSKLMEIAPKLVYFDLGAFFRPITFHLIKEKNISIQQLEKIVNIFGIDKFVENLNLGFRTKNRNCEVSINGRFFDNEELYNPEMNKLTVDIGSFFGDSLNPYIRNIIDRIREKNPVLLNARRPFAIYKNISNHIFLKANFGKRAERKSILENTSLEEARRKLAERDKKENEAQFWNTYSFTKIIDTTDIDIAETLNIVKNHISNFTIRENNKNIATKEFKQAKKIKFDIGLTKILETDIFPSVLDELLYNNTNIGLIRFKSLMVGESDGSIQSKWVMDNRMDKKTFLNLSRNIMNYYNSKTFDNLITKNGTKIVFENSGNYPKDVVYNNGVMKDYTEKVVDIYKLKKCHSHLTTLEN